MKRISAIARDVAVNPSMVARAALCLAVIMSGLALRRFGLGHGLPATIVKYGGSILWGAMLFLVVAIAAPRRSRWDITSISAVIAVCVELLRLVHAPWLDDFRLTLAGALLLGRIFSPWDIIAYGAGIGVALGLDHLAARFHFRQPPSPHSAS